jgi:spore coat polysaccharide biosynthesis protein SpsF (cytidylyltransferase family)
MTKLLITVEKLMREQLTYIVDAPKDYKTNDDFWDKFNENRDSLKSETINSWEDESNVIAFKEIN